MDRVLIEGSSEAEVEAEVEEQEPFYNIAGERVALGPLRQDLIPSYQKWINDFFNARTLDNFPKPITLEQEKNWYEYQLSLPYDIAFTVYELEGGRPIGLTVLHDIDFRDRTAEFGLLIGESGFRGKGHGTETTRLLLDYAFTALGLHNIVLRVYEFNRAAIHVYEKAGFKEFGRRRQSRFMGGRLWDTVYMECLSTEFKSTLLDRIFTPDQIRR